MNLENMALREISQTQKDECHIHRASTRKTGRRAVSQRWETRRRLAWARGQEGGADENNFFLAVKVFGNSSNDCSLVSAPSVPEWNSKMS